ncbi:glycosyltransferase [uncultured Microbacterium sp.]|uniref:glycosyltransferase n=1 Tax=uncultured Microbacterium sp. TaxID=191216 RepID=UPI002601DB9D|nr:glycosyltransferase [uncultured Microbacterium sp.]
MKEVQQKVLFVSHTDAFGTFRVGSHHLSSALARNGLNVVHLSTPLSVAHRIAGRANEARAVAAKRSPIHAPEGVTHIIPTTVLPAGIGLRLPFERWLSADFTPADFVLIDQPLLWDRSLRKLGRRIIYRPTDTYPHGVKAKRQRQILSEADGVVATSGEVLRGLGGLSVPQLVLENGVEYERHIVTAGQSRTAVYVGAFDERLDFDALRQLATDFHDWTFIVAGEGTVQPPILPTNVILPGPVPYAALPALLQECSVGLIPLSNHPSNAGRSPMKLYEYLATGLRVVSRETPGIRSDPGRGIYTYRERAGLSEAFETAAANPGCNIAGRELARGYSWRSRAAELESFMRSLL